MKRYELKSEDLVLVPINSTDEAYFFDTWNDLEFRKFLFDDEFVSLEMVHEQIEKSKKSFLENEFGIWKLILKESNLDIGFCGLRFAPDMPDEIGLLYGIERKFWGKDFAFKASRIVLNYAFNDLNLKKIVALANPENIASWKILENLGMHFVKEFKTEIEKLRVYEISKEGFLIAQIRKNLR